jgi:hypothetical protein
MTVAVATSMKEATAPLAPVRLRNGTRVGRRVFARLAATVAAIGSLVLPSVAHAQQVVVVDEGEYRGPNWGLLSSGIVVFGGTYMASIVVAGTSDHAGDKALYAPLVGPWLDLVNRCPGGCNNDLGNKVLLGLDGVFQGIGALSIVSSFFMPRTHARGVARSETAPSFSVLPASLGRGAPGLLAVGTF